MTDLRPTPAVSSIPRYRHILKAELPAHYLEPDRRIALWFLPHAAVIGIGLWLLTAHLNWWVAPLISLAIGHSFGCLGFLGHELCHGGAIKNVKLRHFLTGLAFSPFAIGAHLWSRWHNGQHHGHTQVADLDPDRLFLVDEYKNNVVLKWLYRRSPLARNLVIFGFFSMMMTQHNITMLLSYLKDEKTGPAERRKLLLQFFIPKALWILGTAALGWPVLLMGYVVPLLVGNAIVIGYISTNHFLNPLADERDVLAGSLSVTLPKWLGWLDVLHLRFGAHVAHHLFPQAPTRYCRAIEDKIAELWPDRFHRMPLSQALKLLWNTPWVYDNEGKELIHPENGEAYPTLGNGLSAKD